MVPLDSKDLPVPLGLQDLLGKLDRWEQRGCQGWTALPDQPDLRVTQGQWDQPDQRDRKKVTLDQPDRLGQRDSKVTQGQQGQRDSKVTQGQQGHRDQPDPPGSRFM